MLLKHEAQKKISTPGCSPGILQWHNRNTKPPGNLRQFFLHLGKIFSTKCLNQNNTFSSSQIPVFSDVFVVLIHISSKQIYTKEK